MNTQQPAIVDQLRDLKRRVETYGKRRSELETLKFEIEQKSDFTLGDSELGLYAQTAAGVELAKAIEKPLRAQTAKMLSAAANEFSRMSSRIQALHRAIDDELKRRVIASLPEDLAGVEVVTGEIFIDVREAFVSKVAAPSKLHIKQSRIGADEFSARLDPMNVTWRAMFDPVAPLAQVMSVLADAVKAIERLNAEEARCHAALAQLQKKAA